jgi:hypothetical protein
MLAPLQRRTSATGRENRQRQQSIAIQCVILHIAVSTKQYGPLAAVGHLSASTGPESAAANI